MPREYCAIREGTLPVDVFLLHGYKSSTEKIEWLARWFNNLGFNVIRCEYIGHGKRMKEGDNKQWYSTIEEIEDRIRESENKVVLAGLSMGGTIAITIGMQMEKVAQVFAVSAAYSIPVDPVQVKKLSRMFNEEFTWENTGEIRRAMPLNHGSCRTSNKNKFFLVHSRNDGIVTFDNLVENVKMLCLPEENILVYDYISGIGSLDHVLVQYDRRTLDFIERNIVRN